MSGVATLSEREPAVDHRIRSLLPEMSAATAKVARYLLGHPQAPLTMSVGELAEGAGTSAATVTRFCRALGYPGYVALRVRVATDLGRTTALDPWASEIGEAFGPTDTPEELLNRLISSHTRMLHEAPSAIDLAAMHEIARHVATSRQVDLYGVGHSAVLAEILQGRLYRIGIRAYAWSEVHTGLTSAAIQGPGSVAIALSSSGRTEETIQMLTAAGLAGAITVAISNHPRSPLAEAADYRITTSIYERLVQPDDLSSLHGALLVLDLLYLMVAQQDPARSSDKLAASATAVSTHRRPRELAPRTPGPTTTGPSPTTRGRSRAEA